MAQWKEGWGESPNEKKRKQQWKQGWEANSSPGTSMAEFRQLDQASKGPTKPYTPTKTIGENIFLVNALPIKQTDPFPKKVGKGLVNAAFSTLEAPTEALRHVSILGGDVLTGKGVQPIPKNTSFVEDILPNTLSKPIKGLTEKHPFLGAGVQMGLEVISDPTIMMGVGVGKTMLSPEALSPGRLAKGRKAVEEMPGNFDYLNDIKEPVPRRPADFTADAFGNISRGEPQLALPVARGKGGMAFNPLGKQNAAQGQIRGNTVAFPQDSPLPKTSGDNLGRSPFSKSQVAGTEERGVSRNIRTDKARPDELRDAISENPMTYDPLANKETLSKAQAIYADGLEPAVTKLNELLKDMKPEAAPLAKMIADDLTKMGQVDRAREILSNAAVRATEAGQFGQAFRILRDADPQTFLMTMDKQLLQMNKQGRELYGKKWKQIDLTEAEKEAIAKLKKGDQQAYDDLMNVIGERIANIMPSTALEKFDSWRRMAMLLNPKTHIRNIGGNFIMMGLRKSADTLAAGLEKTFLKQGQRTKSFGWSKDKNLVDIVNRDWEAIAKDFTGGKVTLKNMTKNFPSYGRWDIENMRALNREKRIFKNDLLEKGSNLSRNTLSAEDYFFKERAYKDALGGYMNANKMTEVTETAREYAKRRALEATYQDANMVATWLNKVKSSGGIGGKMIEAAIPFVKTPTNLVSRAIEYSPAGILRLLSKQNQTPAMAIEVLAQGLTGTAVAGLGYQLANMGWIRAERSTSRNAEALMQEAGDQPYSFITPIGSYTFDWAQPIAVPLFMGVALYESLMKQDKIDPDAVAESIAAGGDTIFNLSMLQNVKQLLGGGFGSVTEQIAGLPVSYIEQAYPTIFGQVARTVDDTKRSTYDTTGMGKFGRQIAAKTPFASKLLEPRLDIWGNEQKQGGAAQQFLSPGYSLPKNEDRATQEMVRLYRATKETAMLPKQFKGRFTVNGEQVKLTPKHLTAFQRDMGQANYKEISQAIRTTEYQKASDENKVKIIRKIVQGNYDDAKQEYMDKMGIESGKSAKESKTWKAGW